MNECRLVRNYDKFPEFESLSTCLFIYTGSTRGRKEVWKYVRKKVWQEESKEISKMTLLTL